MALCCKQLRLQQFCALLFALQFVAAAAAADDDDDAGSDEELAAGGGSYLHQLPDVHATAAASIDINATRQVGGHQQPSAGRLAGGSVQAAAAVAATKTLLCCDICEKQGH